MDALKIREKLDLKNELVQSYNNLGKYYFLTGDNQNAEYYLNKALAITETINVLKSKVMTTQILTEVYIKQGKYKDAIEMHKFYKALNDSLFNNENIEKMSRLEMEYEFLQHQKDLELDREKEKVKNQRKEFIYIGITGIAVLSIIILTLLLYLSRNKTKQAKLEQANLQLEKDSLRKELEYKNKELTTNVMYLVKKNEFITSIAEKLIKSKIDFKKENQALIQELIQELQLNSDDTVWKEFELRFMDVHKDFYNKLNEKFPDLSPNEKKLCAFLRLNMSTKDISAITFQSPTTLDVARSRLRKKLGLDRDENLIVFLTGL
jgi:DNA-binding CsgD family transcriptional regulator